MRLNRIAATLCLLPVLPLVLTTTACSGDSGSSSGSASGSSGTSGAATPGSSGTTGTGGAAGSCPSVGFKACPNDTPVSAADVTVCQACGATWQALSACQGTGSTCGADGKKADKVKDACLQALSDYLRCTFEASGKDGG